MTIEDRSAHSLLLGRFYLPATTSCYCSLTSIQRKSQQLNDFYVTKKSRTIDRDRVIEKTISRRYSLVAGWLGKTEVGGVDK